MLGAIGASSAAAALPEWGRCVKVSGTGEFTRENCVAVSKTHTGNYEWAPGPGASPGVNIRLFNPTLEFGEAQLIEYLTAHRAVLAPDLLVVGRPDSRTKVLRRFISDR